MEVYHDVRTFDILELRQAVESKEFYLAVKRIFDICASFFIILFFSPLLIFIAILIKFSSHGPIIFKQRRVGQHGKYFTMYKFRTMTEQSQDPRHKTVCDMMRKGTFIKTKHDPRITPLGKYLRQTSIDEMPQLFNVLFGDMSLVGPRPCMEEFIGDFEIAKSIRAVVKPGITGLWQIKNRKNNSSIHYMIDYDFEYIECMNFVYDMKILILTIPAVILCDGAL
jgi:lipopolysaccharide/colanic/teichoic acid biosynthesis glycosyltransferase